MKAMLLCICLKRVLVAAEKRAPEQAPWAWGKSLHRSEPFESCPAYPLQHHRLNQIVLVMGQGDASSLGTAALRPKRRSPCLSGGGLYSKCRFLLG
jgi:hypothetical protein